MLILLFFENGRYSKPLSIPREKRLCNFCKLFVEDEKHFVLSCSKYDQCRLNYNDIFNVNTYPNVNPIKELVNPKDITAARRICCFLKNCFNTRKESQQ